jgi:uncharacterized protein (TIGR02996 family)
MGESCAEVKNGAKVYGLCGEQALPILAREDRKPTARTAMSTENAFLQAIHDNPEDDTTRLVYADFLEERGDPRGEFIRLEVELWTMSPDDPRYEGLDRRRQELLEDNRSRWVGPLDEVGIKWEGRNLSPALNQSQSFQGLPAFCG